MFFDNKIAYHQCSLLTFFCFKFFQTSSFFFHSYFLRSLWKGDRNNRNNRKNSKELHVLNILNIKEPFSGFWNMFIPPSRYKKCFAWQVKKTLAPYPWCTSVFSLIYYVVLPADHILWNLHNIFSSIFPSLLYNEKPAWGG